MTRPNRCPYTKSQWEETTTAVYSYNNGEYELFRGLENKFTGERVEVKQWKKLSWHPCQIKN